MPRLTDEEYAIARIVPDVVMDLLALKDWSVEILWGRIPNSPGDDEESRTLGLCTPSAVYRDARIEIDVEECADLKQVVEVIRHEVLHILNAEFFCVVQIADKVLADRHRSEVVHESYQQSIERFVLQMERAMQHGIPGGSIKSLIREATKRHRAGVSVT